jgi:hypothetical protein
MSELRAKLVLLGAFAGTLVWLSGGGVLPLLILVAVPMSLNKIMKIALNG